MIGRTVMSCQKLWSKQFSKFPFLRDNRLGIKTIKEDGIKSIKETPTLPQNEKRDQTANWKDKRGHVMFEAGHERKSLQQNLLY